MCVIYINIYIYRFQSSDPCSIFSHGRTFRRQLRLRVQRLAQPCGVADWWDSGESRANTINLVAEGTDGGGGQYNRFSGADLDGKAYRQWKLWVRAKMLSMKDIQKSQRGPFVYCLLEGLALECVEHLQLEDLSKDDGDEAIWKVLGERFPDKMQNDHMAGSAAQPALQSGRTSSRRSSSPRWEMSESRPGAFDVKNWAIGLATVPTKPLQKVMSAARVLRERPWYGRLRRPLRPCWSRHRGLASSILDVAEPWLVRLPWGLSIGCCRQRPIDLRPPCERRTTCSALGMDRRRCQRRWCLCP